MWPDTIMLDVLIQERERELAIREREYVHRSELASARKDKGAVRRALTAAGNAIRRIWSPRQPWSERAESGSPNVEVST
jgi:hypothetical protein